MQCLCFLIPLILTVFPIGARGINSEAAFLRSRSVGGSAAEGTSATVWQLRAPLPLFGSWGHLFHCLAAEGIGLKSLQPFSLSCCLIMKEAVTSTLRFCSLKQPLMGHHRFGPLLITYLCWGESSNYLLASHYHLIFPTSKWNQARKMEKNYARYSYLFLLLKLLGFIFQARRITGMIK